jgi:hypothetical protein
LINETRNKTNKKDTAGPNGLFGGSCCHRCGHGIGVVVVCLDRGGVGRGGGSGGSGMVVVVVVVNDEVADDGAVCLSCTAC